MLLTRIKLLSLFLAISLLPLIVLSLIFYQTMDYNIKNDSFKKLEAISEIQKQRLEEAFQNVIESSKLISSRTQMRVSLDIYNKTRSTKAKAKIKKIISDALQASNNLLGISILDLKGNTVTEVGDMEIDFASYIVSSPLQLHQVMIGQLMVKYSIESILKDIKFQSSLSKTEETLIFKVNENKQLTFLMAPNSKYQSDSKLKKNLIEIIEQKKDVGEVQLLQEEDRNEIYSSVRFSNIAQIGLITKVDKSELMAPIKKLQSQILVILGILILIVLYISFVSSNYLIKIKNKSDSANKELEKQVEFITAILESSDYSIITTNTNGLIMTFNKAAERILGYQANEMIGINTPAIFHDSDEVVEYAKVLSLELRKEIKPGFEVFVAKSTYLGKADQREWTYITKDGFRVPVLLSVTPIKNKVGEVYSYMGIAADISLQKEQEKIIQEKSTLLERSYKELEQFAYIASHDLQEPLRMITSYIEVLEEDLELDENTIKYMNYVTSSAARMRQLISDILDYSRVGKKTELVEIDLNQTLKDILENSKMLIDESATKLNFANLPTIYGSRVEIFQLFQNLISNAIKFRSSDKTPEIEIKVEDDEQFWKFSIRDNGIGMSEEYFDKIFQVFQRLNSKKDYQGTGIGLAICQKTVEHHGGKIWVESKLGQGTTFFFTISKFLSNDLNQRI